MSFYNTTHETGDTLKESHHKASSQESKILNYFLRSGEPLSPSMILQQMSILLVFTENENIYGD